MYAGEAQHDENIRCLRLSNHEDGAMGRLEIHLGAVCLSGRRSGKTAPLVENFPS